MAAMKTNGTTRKTTLFSTFRYEHLVAGFSGGVTSTLILHPLDLIKIRFAGMWWDKLHKYSIFPPQLTRYSHFLRSKWWSNDNSTTISWPYKCFHHHISTRGFEWTLQRCNTECLWLGQCMGFLFSIVSGQIQFYKYLNCGRQPI